MLHQHNTAYWLQWKGLIHNLIYLLFPFLFLFLHNIALQCRTPCLSYISYVMLIIFCFCLKIGHDFARSRLGNSNRALLWHNDLTSESQISVVTTITFFPSSYASLKHSRRQTVSGKRYFILHSLSKMLLYCRIFFISYPTFNFLKIIRLFLSCGWKN